MKTSRTLSFLACAAAVALAACSNGHDGKDAPPGGGTVTPTELDPGDEAPGVEVVLLSVDGATGPEGAFLPGDRPALRFRLERADGTPWTLSEMTSGEALVSGPTKNYQRVLPLADDVIALSSDHGDGSYTYRFAPLPATYASPYNDSPAFGEAENELTGQPLLSGTYTLGLSFAWAYEVAGDPFLDVGELSLDVLLGPGAGELAPRRVTDEANCNRCHVALEAHGGRRRDLTQCLMCHTAGAEDSNDPAVLSGTPGVSIESRVLFHKIHNGSHLPSVIGIAAGPGGVLDYTVPSKPYQLVDAAGGIHDYSAVGFPAWPNRTEPMPEAPLYAALSDEAKAKEDRVRTGVTSCYLCHHDPDGDGPLAAPEDGELIYAMQSRKACGACHDDVIWTQDYIGDFGLMPAQPDESACQDCHAAEPFNPFSPIEAHLHPLRNPTFNTGVVVDLLAVEEAGASDGDGTLDPGEKVELTLAFKDDAGAPLAPASLDEVRIALTGPTGNANLVHVATLPHELLTGPGPVTLRVPETRRLELLGHATAAPGDTFTTAGAPVLDLASAPAVIGLRVGDGAALTLTSAAAERGQNYLDVAAGAGFAHGDIIAVGDGTAAEEYAQVGLVDLNRIWLSSPNTPALKPALELDHPAGTAVREVVVVLLTEGVHYALDAPSGTVTELTELGAGRAVLASYTTELTVPQRYPGALNDSPDVDENLGQWSDRALVDGTYTLSVWASRPKVFDNFGTPTTYRLTSAAATAEVLVGDALTAEPYALLDDLNACNACHQDIEFHDRHARGLAACLACHGTAGAEDLPRYVAAGAPETPGARVDLRSMVHKIHHARLLDDPAAFELVGAGDAPYPDNFEVSTFASILLPAQPGATKNCAACHGADNTAWQTPADALHPDPDAVPVLAWQRTCAACHDAPAQVAHMDAQTSPAGAESCPICHGPGEELSVENVHRPR